jgi:hypothetical protein
LSYHHRMFAFVENATMRGGMVLWRLGSARQEVAPELSERVDVMVFRRS